MPAEPIRGLDSLNKAFALAGTSMRKELPRRLSFLAEPVRALAEVNARAIGSGVPWSEMRRGAGRHAVWVFPVQRGTRIAARKRPRFGTRLLTRAMEPALDANRERVGRGIDAFVGRIERNFYRG